MWRYIIFCITILLASNVRAQSSDTIIRVSNKLLNLNPKPSEGRPEDVREMVIVGKDTVDVILPEKNYGRYDRGLFNYLFIPKGQWSFGLTVSYGSVGSQDISVLNVISDLDLDGHIFSINPYISYFFKSNSCLGMRLGYNRSHVDLQSLGMDFTDDLNFNLKDVLFHSESYSASMFYRHYVGLGKSRRFGVFNEVDLAFASGNGQFKRYYNDEPRDTRSVSRECRLNFSPGLCVFIQDNVSFNVSFGIFGLHFKQENQTTNGVEEGSRFTSGADFKFNLFNINLGIAVHI